MEFSTETIDQILQILGIIGVIAGGPAAIYVKKALFYGKALQQALHVLDETKEATQKIYDKTIKNPNRKELAKVMDDGEKFIQGFTNIDKAFKESSNSKTTV